jgi:nitroreductase
MSQRSINEAIRSRRTIHNFRPDITPVELIHEAVEVARWAPNHHRTEPWRFYLLGRQAVAKVIDLNAAIVSESKGEAAGEAKRQRWSEIPGWLAVTSQRSDDPVLEQEDFAATCCAVQNFSLALWEHGVGVKWTTGSVTRHDEFYRALQIDPDQEKVIGLLWYGYPEDIPTQKRRSVDEVLFLRD